MATLKQKEQALERAAKAQARYWDAVRALEQALGFDVEEGGPALADCTVEYLEHEHGPQGEEQEEEDGTAGLDISHAGTCEWRNNLRVCTCGARK